MPVAKKVKSSESKESLNTFTFAVEKELKDAFVNSCVAMDSTASRELRAFMRQYLAKNGQTKLL
jgi:hypothetical protein